MSINVKDQNMMSSEDGIQSALQGIQAMSPQKTDGKWLEDLTYQCASLIADWDISECWLWEDWPDREKYGYKNSVDLGIDIVALRRSDQGLIAIQCKSRKLSQDGSGNNITWTELSTFYGLSSDSVWSERWVVTNGNVSIGGHVPCDPNKPLKFINLKSDLLKQKEVSWSPTNDPRSGFELDEIQTRDSMQTECVRESVNTLQEMASGPTGRARGRIILPCGTGKSRIALRIIEELTEVGGISVVLCPSIALVAQLRREFLTHAKKSIRVIAVCSDETAASGSDLSTDPTLDVGQTSASEVKGLVTTDPDKIFKWISEIAKEHHQIGVIFSTYQSSHQIATTLAKSTSIRELSVVIADEAHRTAGLRRIPKIEKKIRNFTVCHDDSRFPAKYRIYQTATPRVYDLGGKPKKNDNWIVRNMDDQAVFGVELYRKSYVDAVKNQWLSDYRIIALGVNDKHAYDTANSMAKDSGKKLSVTDSLRGLALALVMGGYLKESDTVIRSSINFVNTIKKSKEMTRLLQSQEVRDWVKQRLSDQHNKGDSIAHYSLEHLDADSKVAKREEAKARLAAGTEANPHGIINVGIFGEGTDAPSLSAVGFLEARKSPVDVIQAVGRVMRRSQDKKMGYIICPIVIPSGTDAETWLRNSGPEDGWRELGQILVALRAHDSRIEDELSNLMKLITPSPPDDVTTMVTIGQEGYQSEHYIHHGEPDEVVHDVRDILKGGSDAEDTMIKLEQFDHSSNPERIVSARLNTDGSIEIREDGIQRDKPKPDGTIGPVNFRKSKKRGVEMLNGKAGKIIHYVTTVVTIGRDDHQAEHYIHQGQEGKAETDAVSVLGEQSSDKSKLIELDKIDNPRDLDSDRIISARLKQDDSIEMREAEVQRDKPNSDSILGNLNVEKTKQKGVAMLAGKAGKVIPTPTAKGRKKPDDPLYPYLFDRADSVGITVNLLQKSGLSHNRAKRDANILKDSIQGAAEYLKQDELRPLLDRHFRLDALDDKKRKNQADGCTIAALLLMNACLLHQRIVVGKWLLNVTAMDEIKTSVDTLTKLSDQWNNITRHDFLPVLEPAIEIVRVVRDSGKREGLNRALRHLAAEAEHIAESYADLGADHAGPLFNEVMGNQASDGAYFTRPPAASMVARLSLDVFEQKNGGGGELDAQGNMDGLPNHRSRMWLWNTTCWRINRNEASCTRARGKRDNTSKVTEIGSRKSNYRIGFQSDLPSTGSSTANCW